MATQHWDPETYARNARFVSDYGAALLDILAPRPGERILDVGCGDGVLTEKLVAAGCTVVGIDSSSEQIAAARRRGLDARLMRAEEMVFEEPFDAAFTNATLHWIRNAGAVLQAIFRLLKPGGRFVGEFGGYGNVATIRAALTKVLARRGIDAEPLNPWFFPTAEEYRELLERNGFRADSVSLFPRMTPLPGDLGGWLETFGHVFLAVLDNDDRQRVVQEVMEETRSALYAPERGWNADYVRLRFEATRVL